MEDIWIYHICIVERLREDTAVQKRDYKTHIAASCSRTGRFWIKQARLWHAAVLDWFNISKSLGKLRCRDTVIVYFQIDPSTHRVYWPLKPRFECFCIIKNNCFHDAPLQIQPSGPLWWGQLLIKSRWPATLVKKKKKFIWWVTVVKLTLSN